MRTVISGILAIVAVIALLAVVTSAAVRSINFDRNCTGRLQRAADANTIEIAKVELAAAVDHLNKVDLRSGYTSVLYTTPDEDIGFWYNNLAASLAELDAIPENATQLEKSNVLMKLRETLIEVGDKGGQTVTCPAGISRYPHNKMYAVATWGLLIMLTVFVIVLNWDN